MSRLTVGSIEGLTENSNVISVPTGHTLNAVDGLQIGGVGVGEAVAFTPSWYGLTIGNGTDNWFYIRINDLIVVTGQTTLGSTSAITGGIGFTCPSGTLAGSDFVQMGTVKYGVGGNWLGSAQRNGNTFSLLVHGASGTYVNQLGVSATVPGNWGTGNIIRATIPAMVS